MKFSRIVTPLKVCIAGLVLLWLGSTAAQGGVPPEIFGDSFIFEYEFNNDVQPSYVKSQDIELSSKEPIQFSRAPVGYAVRIPPTQFVEIKLPNAQEDVEEYTISFDLRINRGSQGTILTLGTPINEIALGIDSDGELVVVTKGQTEASSTIIHDNSEDELESFLSYGSYNNLVLAYSEGTLEVYSGNSNKVKIFSDASLSLAPIETIDLGEGTNAENGNTPNNTYYTLDNLRLLSNNSLDKFLTNLVLTTNPRLYTDITHPAFRLLFPEQYDSKNNPQIFTANGSVYEIVVSRTNLSWEESNEYASRFTYDGMQGNLAIINKREESIALSETFLELNSGIWPQGFRYPGGQMWIAGKQLEKEIEPTGGWYWIRGDSKVRIQNYESWNWNVGEPNNVRGNEDHMSIRFDGQWPASWNDEGSLLNSFLVEYMSEESWDDNFQPITFETPAASQILRTTVVSLKTENLSISQCNMHLLGVDGTPLEYISNLYPNMDTAQNVLKITLKNESDIGIIIVHCYEIPEEGVSFDVKVRSRGRPSTLKEIRNKHSNYFEIRPSETFFEDNGFLQFQISPAVGGYTKSNTEALYQWPNSRIEMEAVPNIGYEFVSWAGTMDSTDNPLLFSITEDTILMPVFAEIKTPLFTLQPESQVITSVSNIKLAWLAEGVGDLTYDLLSEGLVIESNEIGTFLINVGPGSEGKQYSVRASNEFGSITSNSVSVTFDLTAPKILEQPRNITIVQGEPLKMSVVASGTTLKYQWYKGAAPVGGASAANYVVEQTQAVDAGDYFVVISNDKGVQASLPIKVSFGARLSVALDGANLTFAVDPGTSSGNWKLQRSSNLLFWEDVQALSTQDLEAFEMPVGDGSVFYRVVEQ